MAKIKVDEDLPRHIVEVARERGHDATSVLGQGWQGTPDDTLWPRIQTEGRWLITADKAFGDLRRFAPGAHAGVIVVRCAQQNRLSQLHLAATVLDRIALDESLAPSLSSQSAGFGSDVRCAALAPKRKRSRKGLGSVQDANAVVICMCAER